MAAAQVQPPLDALTDHEKKVSGVVSFSREPLSLCVYVCVLFSRSLLLVAAALALL